MTTSNEPKLKFFDGGYALTAERTHTEYPTGDARADYYARNIATKLLDIFTMLVNPQKDYSIKKWGYSLIFYSMFRCRQTNTDIPGKDGAISVQFPYKGKYGCGGYINSSNPSTLYPPEITMYVSLLDNEILVEFIPTIVTLHTRYSTEGLRLMNDAVENLHSRVAKHMQKRIKL